MSYYYSIGGIGYEFAVDRELYEYSPYDVFRVDRDVFLRADEKHHFRFYEENYVLPEKKTLIFSNDSTQIYECDGSFIHVNNRFDEVNYDCVVVSPKNESGGSFYFTNGCGDKLKVTTELLRCCDFVSSLLFYNCFILHCAYVIHDGKAILFSAPSEGGKSTQAALWEKYRGAEIINGDRAILKNVKGEWYVYSLPFCGSSGICKNKVAPLELIAFVNKADENSVEALNIPQKLQLILPQITFESYKHSDFSKVLDMTEALISKTRMVKLNCTVSEQATAVLEREVLSRE